MTTIQVSFIVCDQCGTNTRHHAKPNEARVYARSKGWHRPKIDGKWHDVCPTCVASGHGQPTPVKTKHPWSKAFEEVENGASIRSTAIKYGLPHTTFWQHLQDRKKGGKT